MALECICPRFNTWHERLELPIVKSHCFPRLRIDVCRDYSDASCEIRSVGPILPVSRFASKSTNVASLCCPIVDVSISASFQAPNQYFVSPSKMSITTANSSSATDYIHCPPHRKFTPNSTPISLLPTQNARLYHHIHPALLLSIFYLRSSAIVADPVSELFQLAFVAAGLQMLYVVICLPTAKAGVLPKNTTNGPRKPKPGAKRTSQGDGIAGKMVVHYCPT